MVKISAVIITFNEEKNIERCINSVKSVVDEVVVVDSYSKDKTEDICRQQGVNFIKHPFEGHIQQKNFAASKAKYNIVLSLDADEALSDDLKNSIIRVKSNFVADGYFFNRLSSYCGQWIRHCGWYPDRKLRLWDRTKGQWGGENPHDKFIMVKGAQVKHLKGDLLHYTFHTVDQHMDTVNKFSGIAAQMRFNKGKKTNTIKIVLKPFFKFITLYFIKLGFLDGYYGYVVCKNSAHSAFLKEVKLRELHRKNK